MINLLSAFGSETARSHFPAEAFEPTVCPEGVSCWCGVTSYSAQRNSRNCENLLGMLLCERWNALSPSTLSRGTGVLAGFGRIPAFHWDKWRRLSADSPMTGWSAILCDVHVGWVCVWSWGRLRGLLLELRNIWKKRCDLIVTQSKCGMLYSANPDLK